MENPQTTEATRRRHGRAEAPDPHSCGYRNKTGILVGRCYCPTQMRLSGDGEWMLSREVQLAPRISRCPSAIHHHIYSFPVSPLALKSCESHVCGSRLTASNWGGVPHSGFVKETLCKIRNMFQGKYKGENGKKRSNDLPHTHIPAVAFKPSKSTLDTLIQGP